MLLCCNALIWFILPSTEAVCVLKLRCVQIIAVVFLQVRNKQMEVEVFYELLHNLREELGVSNLTSRSQQLLMQDHSNWKSFVDQYKDIPLKKQVLYSVTSVK